jgi:hypothetical protein
MHIETYATFGFNSWWWLVKKDMPVAMSNNAQIIAVRICAFCMIDRWQIRAKARDRIEKV